MLREAHKIVDAALSETSSTPSAEQKKSGCTRGPGIKQSSSRSSAAFGFYVR